MAHYYDRSGKLIVEVPRARGRGFRATTLADARKLGLFASSTTILSMLSKPGLESWKVQQAIKAAKDHPFFEDDELIKVSMEKVDLAAEFGTAVHAGINHWLEGKLDQWVNFDSQVADVLNAFMSWYTKMGLEVTHTERTFVNTKLGYAGTLDWEGMFEGKPTFIDFKTQEFDRVQDADFYEEHPLQLASYACGVEELDHRRISVIISRTTPGLVATKEWTRDNRRYDQAWLWMLSLWKILKNYDPGDINWQAE